MGNKARPAIQLNSIQSLECPADKAKRLLEKLKSPNLHLASQHLKTKNPKAHHSASLRARHMAEEIETISRGRFSLARDQQRNDSEWTRYTRLKMLHHACCQNYSWLTIAQLDALGGEKNCCCYCADEPLSLSHIGHELTAIQRYVELRSFGQTRFSHLNCVDYADLSDIFIFQCLSSSCRGLEYDAPFLWFLDTPWRGCPSCKAKAYGQDRL